MTFSFREAYAAVVHERTADNDSDIQEMTAEFEQRNMAGHFSIQTITALFRDRPECAGEEATKGLIGQSTSDTDEAVLKTMIL